MTAQLSRFSPSCNCCGDDCMVFADAFERSDVGSNWSIQSGAWSIPIAEGSLQTTSANSEIDQGVGGTAGKASASVSSTASGDQLQVGLGSGGNYYAAELEVGTGKFRLVQLASGTRTVLRECSVSAGIAESYTISLCSDTYPYGGSPPTARLYTATFQGIAYHTWGDAVGGYCESFNAVLATGALTGTASFADFSLSNAYCEDSSCPSCGQCCWPPGAATLPDQVQVVVSGITTGGGTSFENCTDSECDAIDGTYLLDQADDCGTAYCACYELTDLDLTCTPGGFGGSDPITTIRFTAFNSSSFGGFSGPCNLFVDFLTAGGFIVFHFDLGLGPDPYGPPFYATAPGTYSTIDGCGSATLLANATKDSTPEVLSLFPNGYRCQGDSLGCSDPATAIVTPL